MAVLTEKDVNEGKELINIIENLPEEEKKQAVIYIRALADRELMISKHDAEKAR